MKRPPQVWVLSTGILCLLLLGSTECLKATSLIFSRTSTTTTTTEAPAEDEAVTSVSEATPEANQTANKPMLTGIPQIDYIWDPNLPFELKGYNLSDYPFYDRVPDEIDFKCDGLHDGFYASVPHKCQVYHHCLFGTRYDFLCANFTAFDQKTFICHFVSEVDCNNSHKFWHRNDALYQAATTTTPSTTTVQVPITPSPPVRRPAAGVRRRRPFRRRRPQYDYYYDDEDYELDRARDDYYDDPPLRPNNRRRKRPRPNRRPEYEEYEYEDDRYERRGSGRRDDRDRRPYDRREEDRRPSEDRVRDDRRDEDRRMDDDRRYDDRRILPGGKFKDRQEEKGTDYEEDRRTSIERRRPDERNPAEDRRRPSDDRRLDDDYDRRSPSRPRKRDRLEDKDDDRRNDRPRKTDDEDRRPFDRPRKPDDEERRFRPKGEDVKDDRRTYDRPRKIPEDERRYRPKDSKVDNRKPQEDTKVLIRPSSGSSVYDRPRAPPIIRRPVPVNERDKFDYKLTAAPKPSRKELEEEEYYDDYEDDPKPPSKAARQPSLDSRKSNERRDSLFSVRRPQLVSRRPVDDIDEEIKVASPKRPLHNSRQESERNIANNRKPISVEEEYSDEYEEDKSESASKERDSDTTNKKDSKEETRSREETPKETHKEKEPIVRVVKRPFLPSRGGNPYAARGLQPVGNKALDATTEITTDKILDKSQESPVEVDSDSLKGQNKPSVQEHNKDSNQQASKPAKLPSEASSELYDDDRDAVKLVTSRPRGDYRPTFRNDLPRTTQKPKVPDNYRNPLDIIENEYDVTLNDALNPTLPNLPVRSVPSGFSAGRDGYIGRGYQRSRLIGIDGTALSPAGSDYVYQIKQPQTVVQPNQSTASRYNPYVTVQQINYRHPSTAPGPYYSTFR